MSDKQQTTPQTANPPALIAYHAPASKNAPWTRIGAAWEHKDGEGLTLQLDLVPVGNGRIVLRKPDPKSEAESA